MARTGSVSPKQLSLALLAALALYVMSSLFMMPYVPDDSYISFRYAENLVNGEGLAFNEAEQPVEAYSNLLWIFVCAALYKAGMDLPTVMPFVGVLVGALNILLLWILFVRRRMPGLQMLFPLLFLASSGPFITYAVSALEAPLYALLLLAMINFVDLAFASGRLRYYLLLAFSGVLISLCRPEGIIVLPAILALVFFLARRRRGDTPFHKTYFKNLVVALASFVIIIGVYHVWRISYFGEVLPTPFLSKGGAGKSVFAAWSQNMTIYFDQQGDYYPPIGYYFVALTVIGILGLMVSRSGRFHKQTETVALALALLHTAVYFNFKDWMPAMRYHSSTVGLFLITAAHVQGPVFKKKEPMDKQAVLRFWMAGISVLFISFSVLGNLRVITKRTETSKEKSLVALGKWLHDNMPASSVLAMSDVGVIPYYSGFKTIDIHVESLTDLYIAKHGFSKDYFYRRHPDIVIFPSRSQIALRFYPEHFALAEEERFQRTYRHLGSVRYDWIEDRSYWVYIPRGWPRFSDEAMDRFPHGVGAVKHKKN
ncbi:MAG: hypothetical protein ACE5EO_03075 [Candidatus Krumholzibacteriia bacterium]